LSAAATAATALVFAALSALHLYWAAGGHRGGSAAVPTRTTTGPALFVPSTGATIAVAAALALAAWIVAVKGGLARPLGPRWLYVAGAWGLGAVMLARAVGDFRYVGLFKRVRGTPFAALDDGVYTPLCAALAVAVLWLASRPWPERV
jgi:hypothetical protein